MVEYELKQGDCIKIMEQMIKDGIKIHSVVTDPPYHLASIVSRFGKPGSAPTIDTGVFRRSSTGFMGKEWDGGDIAFRKETWELCHELLLPGGHLLAFAATKNYHRMAVAIEDAGFEIRDQIGWLYGTGFPKSHDISKKIDQIEGVKREVIGKTNGSGMTRSNVEQGAQQRNVTEWDILSKDPVTDKAKQWSGWGTALKPAWEPICVARKELDEKTIALNVLEHGTGALNIDSCRVGIDTHDLQILKNKSPKIGGFGHANAEVYGEGTGITNPPNEKGRWPANVIHDGSDEVVDSFPQSGKSNHGPYLYQDREYEVEGFINTIKPNAPSNYGDQGSAARFFYSAKATKDERDGSKHPTVKPVALMRYLVRMVTPKGGLVLDPFSGTGTTLEAAYLEEINSIGIEKDPEYTKDILKRMSKYSGALF